MKPWGLPLWDLITRRKGRPRIAPAALPAAAVQAVPTTCPTPAATPTRVPSPASPATRRRPAPRARAAAPSRSASMADRYESIVRLMLATHGVKVRKWRTAMSGVAWELKYDDGSVRRYIEAPRPRGPMSAAIFLHEIGHHAIGFNRYRPRCLEEYHAWKFAVDQMEAHALNVTKAVRRRMHASLHYAIAKARRRGLMELPPELEPFVTPPSKSPRSKR